VRLINLQQQQQQQVRPLCEKTSWMFSEDLWHRSVMLLKGAF